MSAQFILNNAINDLKNTLHNEFIMQNIVAKLAEKINSSKIIQLKHKLAINNYFNINKNSKLNGETNITDSSIINMLTITLIYYLTDLNYYDYHLINYAFKYNLQANEVIVLLLLNNIHDINLFCNKKVLTDNKLYTIQTLKKLSALYKIQYNF